MRCTIKRVLLFLFLTAGCLFAQVPAIHNFGTVQEFVLYRGAQPTKAELHGLADFGIKTIIDLRNDRSVQQERAIVERELHIRFLNIPLSGLHAPTDDQVKQVLAAIDASPKPVFIHCKLGEDRTGVAVAALRISKDHWTNRQAFQEAESYHINRLQFGMRAYIKHYKPQK
jgi:tyrosine-protein phosphatase SIW14